MRPQATSVCGLKLLARTAGAEFARVCGHRDGDNGSGSRGRGRGRGRGGGWRAAAKAAAAAATAAAAAAAAGGDRLGDRHERTELWQVA
jgi:hypothetical protein